MKVLFLLPLLFSLVSCAPAINQKSAAIHAQSAQNAIQNNDWDVARVSWAKAVKNGELAGESDQNMAILYYEYGRALGTTCYFQQSESYLKKAYDLDKKTGGPIYMSIVELARLNLDQKKYEIALPYFTELMPILDKINAKEEAPIEYSNILTEYSKVLANTGNHEKSKSLLQEAASIRKNNQGGYSITERTLYGSQCK